MNGFLAIVLALLGVAMFSGSLWMQRDWLPQSRMPDFEGEPQAVSIENEFEVEKSADEKSGQDTSWATDHVILK
jgi:hypothetical protein